MGRFVGQGVGWDWASLQLDDGTDLMASIVWEPVDHRVFAEYGTLATEDGAAQYLAEGDLDFTASNSWTSPDTGIVYPIDWNITVDSLGLDLLLKPVLTDAEFASSDYLPGAYWEGEVTVQGTREGREVSGRRFVELVGYDPQ